MSCATQPKFGKPAKIGSISPQIPTYLNLISALIEKKLFLSQKLNYKRNPSKDQVNALVLDDLMIYLAELYEKNLIPGIALRDQVKRCFGTCHDIIRSYGKHNSLTEEKEGILHKVPPILSHQGIRKRKRKRVRTKNDGDATNNAGDNNNDEVGDEADNRNQQPTEDQHPVEQHPEDHQPEDQHPEQQHPEEQNIEEQSPDDTNSEDQDEDSEDYLLSRQASNTTVDTDSDYNPPSLAATPSSVTSLTSRVLRGVVFEEFCEAVDRTDCPPNAASLIVNTYMDGLIKVLAQHVPIPPDLDLRISGRKIGRDCDKMRAEKIQQQKGTVVKAFGVDGKINRDTLVNKETHSGRRRASKEEKDNITVCQSPCGSYLGHFQPPNSTGKSMCDSLVSLFDEREIVYKDAEVINIDGTRTNTGLENGMVAHLEEHMGRPLQRGTCILHGIERPWLRLYYHVDGGSSGPGGLTGNIGKEISSDTPVHEIPVNESFETIPVDGVGKN